MSVHRVTVVGAGLMGHGLAVQFAREGRDVVLVDHRESNLDRARDRIAESAQFLHEEGLLNRTPESLLDDVSFTVELAAGVADADLVLETVSEDLDVKREVFRTVADAAPADAVLASNTSGFMPTRLAESVPDAADRVVVCHWWNPPYLLPLVEVVPGEGTADRTVERTVAFVEAVDRTPVVIRREVPGFVWNRIQFAVVRECMYLLDQGVASLEDIDAAVRDGYALRTAVVGPFETMDLAGLDLFRAIAGNLYPELCDADEPSDRFDAHVERGNTGVEQGEGFYRYDESPERVIERRNRRLAALRRSLDGE